jgi:hypothetical protein
MVIDARTQPGWTGSPIVELNGAGAGSGSNGLNILGVSGQSPTGFKVTVAGFVINRFSGNGIYYGWTSANGKVAGNYIGTNSAGTAASANGGAGVYIHGWVAGPTTIGGTVSADRNLISGNGTQGIYADKDSIVQGNLIGTNAAGTLAVPNVSHGVTVRAGTHVIGGSSASARNLISGNGGQGVNVETSSTSVVISGNYIGTNVTGSAALGNTGNGVQTAFSSGVTVGGSTPGSGNLISGNGTGGVRFNNTCAGFVVAGNIIGLNAAGTAAVANNGSGVWTFCSGATVGGTSSASRNIISGNTQSGINFASGNNVARANWIGLDAAGTSVIANGQHGVYAVSNAVTLGGPTAGMGNAIAGASGSYYAISVASSSGNSILGNTIGVQGDGVTALASPGNGILLNAVNNSTIGGVDRGFGQHDPAEHGQGHRGHRSVERQQHPRQCHPRLDGSGHRPGQRRHHGQRRHDDHRAAEPEDGPPGLHLGNDLGHDADRLRDTSVRPPIKPRSPRRRWTSIAATRPAATARGKPTWAP